MKVWWCEEHEHPSDDAEQCYETDWVFCRMVEMQLVPADARSATDPKDLRVRQLAELCEHGEYREHPIVRSEKAHLDNQPTNWVDAAQMASQGITIETCPGGQLVPADARMETQCPNCKFVYEAT